MSAFIKTCFFMVDTPQVSIWMRTHNFYTSLDHIRGIRHATKDNWVCTERDMWSLTDGPLNVEADVKAMRYLHDKVLNPMLLPMSLDAALPCNGAACKFFSGSNDAVACPIMEHLFPLYALYGVNPLNGDSNHDGWLIVHPDERPRMQRIVNGTDNPIIDLLHELRFNMAIDVAGEVDATKNEYNKRTRRPE